MNCDGVRDLLSAYLDGELSPGELLRVEQHLRRCHACADEVDSLRQTIALVNSLDEVEVPASFHVGLHERLVALGPPAAARRAPSAPSWQRNVRRWAVPAVAAAAVLAIGISTYSNVMDNTPDGILHTSVLADQFTKNQTVVATPTDQQTNTEPAQSPAVAQGDEPKSTDKQAGQGQTPVTGSGSNKVADNTAANPGTAPGPVGRDGGAGTASTTDQGGTVDAPKMLAVTYTYSVAFDPAKVAELKKNYTNIQEQADSLTLVLPASDYQPTLNLLTTLWPGVKPEQTQQDYGPDIQRDQQKIDDLQAQIDQLRKQPKSEQDLTGQIASLQKAQDEVRADKDMLVSLTKKVVIAIKWQTTAQ